MPRKTLLTKPTPIIQKLAEILRPVDVLEQRPNNAQKSGTLLQSGSTRRPNENNPVRFLRPAE